jgi:AcrR family transcriptional regulator
VREEHTVRRKVVNPAIDSSTPDEPRVPVGRERVIEAAIRLADRDGIAALSMRRLAAAVGLEPMSLYHYVPNKASLVDVMLDRVFAEMALPGEVEDWRVDLRGVAVSARDVLLRHPWACPEMASSVGLSPARLHWMDRVLGRLRAAGFSPALTHHAYHALDSHIVGFVLWVLPYLDQRRTSDLADRAAALIDPAGLPHLVEHMGQHANDRPGDTSEFEFGLDLLLDGLERLRMAEAGGDTA